MCVCSAGVKGSPSCFTAHRTACWGRLGGGGGLPLLLLERVMGLGVLIQGVGVSGVCAGQM